MRETPVNRLERHWPSPEASAHAPQYDSSDREEESSWEDNVQDFLSEHPKLTVAVAAAVGLVLGWIVKRK